MECSEEHETHSGWHHLLEGCGCALIIIALGVIFNLGVVLDFLRAILGK